MSKPAMVLIPQWVVQEAHDWIGEQRPKGPMKVPERIRLQLREMARPVKPDVLERIAADMQGTAETEAPADIVEAGANGQDVEHPLT